MEDAGREQGASGARRAVADLEDRIGPQLELVRDRLAGFNERAIGILKAYPGTCLMCAIGVGFLFGRLASRR